MFRILNGDARLTLKGMTQQSMDCCVTSPPYWQMRDYGVSGQIGLERNPEDYVEKLIVVFREVKRVLKKHGTLWIVLGDTYAGSRGSGGAPRDLQFRNVGSRMVSPQRKTAEVKRKNLIGIPWRVAFALQKDGWYLRQEIIWHKPNPMPESALDRCTRAHEYIFLLSKCESYYFNQKALLSKRSVWTVSKSNFRGDHFATFPPNLVEPMVLAGCPENGTVLDPFSGAGTTGLVATRLSRDYVGIEINPDYVAMSRKRIFDDAPLLHSQDSRRESYGI